MTTIAEKFIFELKQGQINEAINTISESLYALTKDRIEESRLSILEGYGFAQLSEEEKEKKKKIAATQDQGEGDEARDKGGDDGDEGDGDSGDGGDGGDDGDDGDDA